MRASISAANPFVMLTNPESLLQAIEQSSHLKNLHSRVCRPLDRPLIPRGGADDVGRFDAEVDESEVEPDPM